MSYLESGDGGSSQFPPARLPKPEPRRERVRHLVYGSLAGIERTIKILHVLGYAEPNDWSDPLPVPSGNGADTGQPQQWMVILTKLLLME
jgi:hypothetical protein